MRFLVESDVMEDVMVVRDLGHQNASEATRYHVA